MMIRSAREFCLKYKLTQQLGEGGYGAVYLCQHRTTLQLHAVKIMEGDRCTNRTWCSRRKEWLPNELVLWESLSHPNIVNLQEVYRDDDTFTWYLVMEYNPGYQDLFDYIDKNRALSSRDSANIIRQLVNVVYYLTLENVDHRDLKDENILYNPTTRQIKLIDFGSSGKLSSTPYTHYRGTDVYIPPEYFLAGSYSSFSATVWAIGCISYVLLTGDCPFQTRQDVREFSSLEQLNPTFGERTLRLNFIRSCLNPDPAQRILLSDLIRHPWLRV
ncbi:hypothetical protein ACHWQZ_G005341 [Mnemiopsis leidyi]